VIDPELRRRAYRRQQLVLLRISGGLAGILAVAFVILGVVAEQPLLPLLGIFAALVLACWALLPGLGLLGRRTGWRALSPPVVHGADPGRRRRVATAVETGRHLHGEDEELALDLARHQFAERRVWMLLCPVLPLLDAAVATWFGSLSVPRVAVVALLGGAVAVLARARTAEARRYLEATGIRSR
jgi:hypothetical protein